MSLKWVSDTQNCSFSPSFFMRQNYTSDSQITALNALVEIKKLPLSLSCLIYLFANVRPASIFFIFHFYFSVTHFECNSKLRGGFFVFLFLKTNKHISLSLLQHATLIMETLSRVHLAAHNSLIANGGLPSLPG